MTRPLCYLNRKKSGAARVMEAFAAGSGAEITTRLELVRGREAVFWGVDRDTLSLWETVLETGTPFWYIDNGYFRSKWSGGDYLRITKNAEQHAGTGTSVGHRWRDLGLNIKPWRYSEAGESIVVVCQSDFWHERHGDGSAAQFGKKVRSVLAHYTSRSVIVRGKPIGGHVEPPLEEHINGAWATVSYSSMVAAQGLLAGVPAFLLADGAMGTVGNRDLADIEHPRRPSDRERWASVLADNQWTVAEIADGTAWRSLCEKAG